MPMVRDLLVYLDTTGSPVLIGRLWARTRGNKETASFEYEDAWLEGRRAFGIDPELPPTRDPFHTGRPLFNAFLDPAPDRWGQTLLRRYERMRAKKEGRQPRTLLAIDFLTLLDDETRLGALRFRDPGTDAFLSQTGARVPPLLELPKLLSATSRIVDDRESEQDLRLVLAPGTSLGGARPKASVRDKDGHLLIAKFPRRDDDWPVTRWEAATLTLAAAAAVEAPTWRLALVLRRPVMILRRFDRRGPLRVPFMSAMTALGATDGETRSYLELVDFLRRDGADVARDLRQLWRRVVFNILVSNTDDHLRNHAFLRGTRGWRLSPAYDLNPVPVDVKPRVQALAIDEVDGSASLDTAFSVAPAFGIPVTEARAIAREVGRAVARWRDAAAKCGITRREMDRMASAFEHDDLKLALSRSPSPR
jgi:serine/threonine-protein kinase HipA